MLDRLRLLDPRVKIADEAEAVQAARLGAVGCFVYAAALIISTTVFLDGNAMREAMRAGMLSAPHQDPEVAAAATAMIETMMPTMLGMIAAFCAIFAVGAVVCGIVQWKKLTRLIPLFLLLLSVYGLLSVAMASLGRLSGQMMTIELPLWRNILTVGSCAVVLALSIVSFRGGSYLYRLRNQTTA